MSRPMRGSALIEFALAWPVALLLVLATVEVSLWASEWFVARAAALAGARAAAVVGGSPEEASNIALRALRSGVFGTTVVVSCDRSVADARVEVCVQELGSEVDVRVDGSVPSLVPLLPARDLPISAHAVVRKEVFEK